MLALGHLKPQTIHYYYIFDFVSFIQHDVPHCVCVVCVCVCVCVMKYPPRHVYLGMLTRLRSHLLATYVRV